MSGWSGGIVVPDAFYAGGGIGLGPAPVLVQADAYPAPLVTSRDAVAGPTKTAVRDMQRLAAMAGWSSKVTYAKGWVPHAALGTPGARPCESLAVRMWRGPQRAVAVYVETGTAWSWKTLYRWSVGEYPQAHQRVGQFMDALFGTVHGTAPWRAPWIYPGREL